MVRVTVNENEFRKFFRAFQDKKEDYSKEIEDILEDVINLASLDKEEMKDCLEELSIVFVQAPTETAIKKALQMYDSGEYTVANITNKTGVSKNNLYGALGKRSIELFNT